MPRKSIPTQSPPFFDADMPPNEIGYKRPPLTHQFRKGVSGNPHGRPRGARNKRPALHEERLKSIILDEAYRTIKVTEGAKSLTLSMAQAVVRALAVNGARGQLRSAQTFVALLAETERANKSLHEQCLDAALFYKAAWESELERRRQFGETGPEPLPHPEDVVIDMQTGAVAIRRPLSAEARAARNKTEALALNETIPSEPNVAKGAMASDAANAMIVSKRLRAVQVGAKERGGSPTLGSNTNGGVNQTRRLDISTLSNEQLDILEEALKLTALQLGERDSLVDGKSDR